MVVFHRPVNGYSQRQKYVLCEDFAMLLINLLLHEAVIRTLLYFTTFYFRTYP